MASKKKPPFESVAGSSLSNLPPKPIQAPKVYSSPESDALQTKLLSLFDEVAVHTWTIPQDDRDIAAAGKVFWQTATDEEKMRFLECYRQVKVSHLKR